MHVGLLLLFSTLPIWLCKVWHNWVAGIQIAKMSPFRSYVVTTASALTASVAVSLGLTGGATTYINVSHLCMSAMLTFTCAWSMRATGWEYCIFLMKKWLPWCLCEPLPKQKQALRQQTLCKHLACLHVDVKLRRQASFLSKLRCKMIALCAACCCGGSWHD